MLRVHFLFAAWSGYFLAVSAFAGMKGQMTGHHAKIIADIKRRASNFPSNVTSEAGKNAPAPINGPEDSNELIGDLIGGGPYSEVGQEVANIIMGIADGQGYELGYNPPPLGSPECTADACCVWKSISDEMARAFTGDAGRCNLLARGAVRLGFHDAASWNKFMDFGGADGSILFNDEILRSENAGLEEIVDMMRGLYTKWSSYGVGGADLIQMGANVATVVCPEGPRVRSFIGRIDSDAMPPGGQLPDVNADADSLIKLFEDKTIRAHGLVALVGAHTTSQQRFFKPERAFDPQDSTPGIWDVAVYSQTLGNTPQRVLKFPSDVKLSQHPRTGREWREFANPQQGQSHWNDDYSKEYVRLSLLGVNNINDLYECTKVLPPVKRNFQSPDRPQVEAWLQGGFANYGNTIGQLIQSGNNLLDQNLQQRGVNPFDRDNRRPPPVGSVFERRPPRPRPVQRARPPRREQPRLPQRPRPIRGNQPNRPDRGNNGNWPGSPGGGNRPNRGNNGNFPGNNQPSRPNGGNNGAWPGSPRGGNNRDRPNRGNNGNFPGTPRGDRPGNNQPWRPNRGDNGRPRGGNDRGNNNQPKNWNPNRPINRPQRPGNNRPDRPRNNPEIQPSRPRNRPDRPQRPNNDNNGQDQRPREGQRGTQEQRGNQNQNQNQPPRQRPRPELGRSPTRPQGGFDQQQSRPQNRPQNRRDPDNRARSRPQNREQFENRARPRPQPNLERQQNRPQQNQERQQNRPQQNQERQQNRPRQNREERPIAARPTRDQSGRSQIQQNRARQRQGKQERERQTRERQTRERQQQRQQGGENQIRRRVQSEQRRARSNNNQRGENQDRKRRQQRRPQAEQ